MARDRYRARYGGPAVAAAALFIGAVAGAAPAHAQPGPSGGAWVEPHPNPVEPGGQVIVIGSCGDVDVDAVFESLAFAGSRKVDAEVDHHTGQVTAPVRIPQGLRPNTYNVNLYCAGTEQASATLTVTEGSGKPDKHRPTKGPRTGGGGTAGDGGGTRTPLMVAGGVGAAVGLALLFGRRRRSA